MSNISEDSWAEIAKAIGTNITTAQAALDPLMFSGVNEEMGVAFAEELMGQIAKAKDENGNPINKKTMLGNGGGNIHAMKSMIENEGVWFGRNSTKFRPAFISPRILRSIARTPMVGAGIMLRRTQVAPFCTPPEDENKPGIEIRMRDRSIFPNRKDVDEMARLLDWFLQCGRTDFDGWHRREYGLEETARIAASETLLFETLAAEIVYDASGVPAYYKLIDGSTIRKVSQFGFSGNKSDIDPRVRVYGTSQAMEKLNADRVAMIPRPEDILYVQEINSRFTAAYEWKHLAFHVRNPEVDYDYAGYPISPVERCLSAVRGFLNALLYNSNAFDKSSLPKMGIAFKNMEYDEKQARAFQRQWRANFRGTDGVFNVPLLFGDAQPFPLRQTNAEMEYGTYLRLMGSLIFANLSIDTEEVGLHFEYSRSLGSGDSEKRQSVSRSRGLADILGGIERLLNMILMRFQTKSHDGQELWKKYEVKFTGLDPKDRAEDQKLKTEEVGSFSSADEVRSRDDKKPLHEFAKDLGIKDEKFLNALQLAGAMPQNAQLTQMIQAFMQQTAGAEEETFQEGPQELDFDSIIEEAMREEEEEISKAKSSGASAHGRRAVVLIR